MAELDLVPGDETMARWIAKKLGADIWSAHRALGIINRGGLLRGGFILSHINAATFELDMYSEGAMSQGIARKLWNFAFVQWGYSRCVIHVPRNGLIKRVAPKLGFRFECAAVDFYGPGVDALQFAMTRSTCRWIRDNEKS